MKTRRDVHGRTPAAALALLLAAAMISGCGALPQGEATTATAHPASKTFLFSTGHELTIRKNPTTQVQIRVKEWPGQTFLLWLPEWVGELWTQWDPEFARQEFSTTPGGGLRWVFNENPSVGITAELTPRGEALLLEVSVVNLTQEDLHNVRAQNCFHLSAAPDFACDDFSRIHIRTEEGWQTLSQLTPTVGLPMYPRPGFLESGRPDSWDGRYRAHHQETRATSPLIVCTSKDGRRAIGTASEDYQCVFHNQELPYLHCIHSQQAPQAVLSPGERVVFRQAIYFVDGSVNECEATFEKSVRSGLLRLSPDAHSPAHSGH